MSYTEEQAHIETLLLKKQLGHITEKELEQLEALLKSNEEATRQLKWLENRALHAINEVHSIEVDQKWNTFREQIKEIALAPSKRRWIRPYPIVAAAAILGVMLLALSHFFFSEDPIEDKSANQPGQSSASQVTLHLSNGSKIILNQAGRQTLKAGDAKLEADNKTLEIIDVKDASRLWNTLEVPSKLDYKLNLPDGSNVHLNSASKLRFPFSFSKGSREVYLEGEAYFTITPKANQPFIVNTPEGDIVVLGTEFNVNTYTADVLKTALVKGSIKVTDQETTIVLKPGEYLVSVKDGQTVTALDNKSILSWRDGVYFFRNTPFREIVDMIPRWFDVKAVIDDAELKDIPFTGQWSKFESLESFLKPIQYTSGINYTYKANVLHFSK